LNDVFSKSRAEPIKRELSRAEIDSKMGEFYSGGGIVTKCAPGASGGVIITKFMRRRDKPAISESPRPAEENGAEADNSC